MDDAVCDIWKSHSSCSFIKSSSTATCSVDDAVCEAHISCSFIKSKYYSDMSHTAWMTLCGTSGSHISHVPLSSQVLQ